MNNNAPRLKIIFSDILRGYSLFEHLKKQVFLKHFNSFDSANIDIFAENFYLSAQKNHLQSEETKLDYLIKEGLWTKDKDRDISDTKFFISNLRNTKTKIFRQSDIDSLNEQIEEGENKINRLEIEKNNLLGLTIESFVNKKINDFYIYNSLFLDAEFKNKLYDEGEFDNLDEEELNIILDKYKETTNKFSTNNLKKISISPFFVNIFYLCDNNPVNFWGKSIVYLTHYQIELFNYGIYFKNIITENREMLTDDVLSDPDKLEEQANRNKSAKDILDKSRSKGQKNPKLVGVSASEAEKYGAAQDGNIINMAGKSFEEICSSLNK